MGVILCVRVYVSVSAHACLSVHEGARVCVCARAWPWVCESVSVCARACVLASVSARSSHERRLSGHIFASLCTPTYLPCRRFACPPVNESDCLLANQTASPPANLNGIMLKYRKPK
eukprot:6192821-Pleurochrysis_carterae.AAC.3